MHTKKCVLKFYTNQVIVESLTADFFMQKPFWKYKKKDMILKNLFIDVINAVRNIGIKIIVVPLVDNSKIQNIHEMKQVIIFFKEITSILKKNNQIVAFETDLSPKQNLVTFLKAMTSIEQSGKIISSFPPALNIRVFIIDIVLEFDDVILTASEYGRY